jgi:hypothetical protein
MADFQVRSDSIDVEQIMRQIRARIREKRGADYTEAELEQLATVKLERFLDPRGVRSDLVEQFRRRRVVADAPPNYDFSEPIQFETHRPFLRVVRRLLKPLLKLFFNPDQITAALHLQSRALHVQSQVNTQGEARLRHLEDREPLYYELIHNLVVELTRLGIEVHNLKMRVESLSSRLDFDERRARALEGVVQYKPASSAPPSSQPQRQTPQRPAAPAAPGQPAQAQPAAQPSPGAAPPGADAGTSGERRRRRRRRRRRPGQTLAQTQGGPHDAPGGPNGAAGVQTGESDDGAGSHDAPISDEDADDAPAAHDDDWSDDDDRGPESGTPSQ